MNVREIIQQYAAGVRDFTAADLTELNLSSATLSGADLSEANLRVTNLSGANLSGTNLSRANLNVARLSGANLSKAKLTQAQLNVANLIRADLRGAQLIQASLIRAEMVRGSLSGANLTAANLSGADLREATLRQANLSRATFNEANLAGATLSQANLKGAHLNGTNLHKADFSGSNLKGVEIRQGNLTCANFRGADLSGANLRWADLSGANLSWADLSNAKLSGATLVGADLSNANLVNTSLVHADLSKTRLIKANWIGADLTGATLTGAKLYAVSRFGLKTEGLICEWVDLSPDGDQSQIIRLSSEAAKTFFNETLPTVKIIVDTPLDLKANLALASIYNQIANVSEVLNQPPSIEVSVRRTTITFTSNNADLFIIAYLAIVPFKDGGQTHRNIVTLLNSLPSRSIYTLSNQDKKQINKLLTNIGQAIELLKPIKTLKLAPEIKSSANFFMAPTKTIITNSRDYSLSIYYNQDFGKYLMNQSSWSEQSEDTTTPSRPVSTLPPVSQIVAFIKAWDYLTG
ncbi:pentapeptide repeat-containing protein [Moorena bouillonii]|uniref:Pentapeptide repeat-containing protein n=1 Tax=Moorena bouillonii PNG TaxID=568701 RepID=A0A1U7N293_9CYAN|nr:pentapeptide repeat-containing protein [Moorena bouillonii]OLT60075.1 hypothetical protein BJP37_14610 [Moorena bouillonii PNG]